MQPAKMLFIVLFAIASYIADINGLSCYETDPADANKNHKKKCWMDGAFCFTFTDPEGDARRGCDPLSQRDSRHLSLDPGCKTEGTVKDYEGKLLTTYVQGTLQCCKTDYCNGATPESGGTGLHTTITTTTTTTTPNTTTTTTTTTPLPDNTTTTRLHTTSSSPTTGKNIVFACSIITSIAATIMAILRF